MLSVGVHTPCIPHWLTSVPLWSPCGNFLAVPSSTSDNSLSVSPQKMPHSFYCQSICHASSPWCILFSSYPSSLVPKRTLTSSSLWPPAILCSVLLSLKHTAPLDLTPSFNPSLSFLQMLFYSMPSHTQQLSLPFSLCLHRLPYLFFCTLLPCTVDAKYIKSRFSSTCSLLSLQVTVSSAIIIVRGDSCPNSSVSLSWKGLRADRWCSAHATTVVQLLSNISPTCFSLHSCHTSSCQTKPPLSATQLSWHKHLLNNAFCISHYSFIELYSVAIAHELSSSAVAAALHTCVLILCVDKP